MTTTTTTAIANGCPTCGGSAPRQWLFCIDCANRMFEQDGSGQALYDALLAEHDKLAEWLLAASALELTLPRAEWRPKDRERFERNERRFRALAYVLGQRP